MRPETLRSPTDASRLPCKPSYCNRYDSKASSPPTACPSALVVTPDAAASQPHGRRSASSKALGLESWAGQPLAMRLPEPGCGASSLGTIFCERISVAPADTRHIL